MKFKLFFLLVLMGMFIFSSVYATEFELKKSSELSVGDVIVASDGSEIVIEKIEYQGRVREEFVEEESKTLMDVVWGKIAGEKLPDPIVSGGTSMQGLSLGETGVGVRVKKGSVIDLPKEEIRQEKSFWNKLRFWRR
jgi:hypothetical protein